MDPRLKFRFIKPVDLEEVGKTAEIFKQKSKEIEAKILAMSDARQIMRESHVLKSHLKTWQEEVNSLKKEEKTLVTSFGDPDLSWIFEISSVCDEMKENKLAEDHFQQLVIRPITLLRTDLQTWMRHKSNGLDVPDPEPIKSIISNLRASVGDVFTKLDADEENLDKPNKTEAQICNLIKMDPFSYSELNMGIPEEAWDWVSPNDDFLATVLSEFIHLDTNFFDRLEALRQECESLKENCFDQWSPEELKKFNYVWDMFKRRVFNQRRQLTADFLSRFMNKRTTAEFLRLYDRHEKEHQLREKARSIIRTWQNARNDLSIRIRAALLQAVELNHQKKLEAELHQTQRELCSLLKEQVRRWRKEKTELAELEEKEAAKLEAQEKEAQAAQKAKEDAIRKSTKSKIAAHQAMKAETSEKLAQSEAARLAFLRDMHAKQVRIDTARLLEAEKFRLEIMRRNRLAAQIESEKQAKEREDRLEAMRQKVRPVVESDVDRVAATTASWTLKLEERKKEQDNKIDHPKEPDRFDSKLYTFTNAQLYADPRTRITTVLHSAGLLDSKYARTLLANMGSQHFNDRRKDNQSSGEMLAVFNVTGVNDQAN